MQFARVLGTVVATVKHSSLVGVRLMAIQPEDEAGNPDGDVIVAADPLQSGPGDLIEWTTGREAALALPVTYSPVDCAVVRIVDSVHSDRSLVTGRAAFAARATRAGT
ncbi:MAG: ethanolamine utilization protein EutN [Myxococcales bacterium]|nr:ethanolamine utilization protein EutN [Myxococcales bacterium]